MKNGILSRLDRAKSKDVDVSDRIYNAMMADIKEKAVYDARAMVQGELDAANSNTAAAKADTVRADAEITRAEAERDAEKALKVSAESISEDNKTKCGQLSKALELEQTALASKKDELTNHSQVLKAQLKEEQGKVKPLELEIAKLKGQLSVKPQAVKQASPIIPEFKIDNIIRGSNDKIINATITPVRLQ